MSCPSDQKHLSNASKIIMQTKRMNKLIQAWIGLSLMMIWIDSFVECQSITMNYGYCATSASFTFVVGACSLSIASVAGLASSTIVCNSLDFTNKTTISKVGSTSLCWIGSFTQGASILECNYYPTGSDHDCYPSTFPFDTIHFTVTSTNLPSVSFGMFVIIVVGSAFQLNQYPESTSVAVKSNILTQDVSFKVCARLYHIDTGQGLLSNCEAACAPYYILLHNVTYSTNAVLNLNQNLSAPQDFANTYCVEPVAVSSTIPVAVTTTIQPSNMATLNGWNCFLLAGGFLIAMQILN